MNTWITFLYHYHCLTLVSLVIPPAITLSHDHAKSRLSCSRTTHSEGMKWSTKERCQHESNDNTGRITAKTQCQCVRRDLTGCNFWYCNGTQLMHLSVPMIHNSLLAPRRKLPTLFPRRVWQSHAIHFSHAWKLYQRVFKQRFKARLENQPWRTYANINA